MYLRLCTLQKRFCYFKEVLEVGQELFSKFMGWERHTFMNKRVWQNIQPMNIKNNSIILMFVIWFPIIYICFTQLTKLLESKKCLGFLYRNTQIFVHLRISINSYINKIYFNNILLITIYKTLALSYFISFTKLFPCFREFMLLFILFEQCAHNCCESFKRFYFREIKATLSLNT